MTTLNKIRMTIVCMAIAMIGCVCNTPDKPTIETGIIQSAQSANASLLAQVDWKNVFARIHGKVGPDTEIVVTVKQIIGGEIDIRFRGAELAYDIEGQGTGGGWQTNKEYWADIAQIQQRWERADDRAKADRGYWTDQIVDAILKHAATSQPAEKAPTP